MRLLRKRDGYASPRRGVTTAASARCSTYEERTGPTTPHRTQHREAPRSHAAHIEPDPCAVRPTRYGSGMPKVLAGCLAVPRDSTRLFAVGWGTLDRKPCAAGGEPREVRT